MLLARMSPPLKGDRESSFMTSTQQPRKDAFMAYWRGYGVVRWEQLLWYVPYLVGVALFAFLVRRFDPDGRFRKSF